MPIRLLIAALSILTLLLLSLSVFAASGAMGEAAARLLLGRSGFTPAPEQVRELAPLTPARAVDRLLDHSLSAALTLPPAWVTEPTQAIRINRLPEEERKAYFAERGRRQSQLRAWWWQEMLATPSPLTERMTLFWHGHFATGMQKVGEPQLMYAQNVLLRRHALGNFSELLHGLARDPAMLVWLDGLNNRKGQPNENFAREVMELFSLGEGHYSQQDVKEAARAFTGWSRNNETGEFVYRPDWHDDGEKSVLGVSGRLDGDAIIDILLGRPEMAEFIVGKLWREFIAPTVGKAEQREVSRLAALFRESGFEIKPLLRALFTSPAFQEHRGSLVKSPVELITGTLRLFELHPADWPPLMAEAEGMGQQLFNPPNVKGWPGGDAWINSTTLLKRKTFLDRLLRVQDQPPNPKVQGVEALRFDAEHWLARFGRPRGDKTSPLAHALIPVPPRPQEGMDLIRDVLLDPGYQLK